METPHHILEFVVLQHGEALFPKRGPRIAEDGGTGHVRIHDGPVKLGDQPLVFGVILHKFADRLRGDLDAEIPFLVFLNPGKTEPLFKNNGIEQSGHRPFHFIGKG